MTTSADVTMEQQTTHRPTLHCPRQNDLDAHVVDLDLDLDCRYLISGLSWSSAAAVGDVVQPSTSSMSSSSLSDVPSPTTDFGRSLDVDGRGLDASVEHRGTITRTSTASSLGDFIIAPCKVDLKMRRSLFFATSTRQLNVSNHRQPLF